MGGATAWLRKNQYEILRLIEDGRLEWAWDISAAGSCRREIRIWFRALERYKAHLRQAVKAPYAPSCLTIKEVIAAIIGHGRPILKGAEVQALLNCDQNLVVKHLAAGELVMVNAGLPQGHAAGNRSPLILRTSLETFLRHRRIL